MLLTGYPDGAAKRNHVQFWVTKSTAEGRAFQERGGVDIFLCEFSFSLWLITECSKGKQGNPTDTRLGKEVKAFQASSIRMSS